ncbi:hypothetical protein AAG906_031172 [Vitis piasezkii]
MEDTKRKDRIAELYQALKKKNKYLSQISLDKPLQDPLQTISNIYDNTFLHLAIRFKQKDIVKELLKMLPKEGNPPLWKIKNKEGNTILHELACSDSMKNMAGKVLKRYEEYEMLLTARNEFGETPIFCAARHGQTEMFQFLAEKMKLNDRSEDEVKHHLQRDDKTTVLHISITTECFGLAHFIAKEKSYQCLIEEMDQDSMTALRYITCNSRAFGMQKIGRQEFIEEIIKSKSDQKQGLVDVINAAIIYSGTVFTIIYYSFTHFFIIIWKTTFL